MNTFLISLITVAIMFAYAIPGFVLVTSRAVKESSISAFAKLLMYVCQPCLAIYSFNLATYSKELFVNMLIFLGISVLVQVLLLTVFYFIFKRKYEDVRYRIATIATAFGNCAFFGVPIIQAVMPGNNDAVVFTTVFFIGMSVLGYTVASYLITGDKKYISVKQALLNPTIISLLVAVPLFLTSTKLPEQIGDMFTIMAKMTTPLCMIILGMRLATIKIKPMFASPVNYLVLVIKQFVMPLIAFCIVWWLPIELYVKQIMFITCATPVASVVLNFAEMLGNGQESAANMVLLSTLTSIATLPVMLLMVF